MFKDAPNLATFFISFSVFWSKILSQINVKLNVVQIVTIMIKRAQETIGCTTKLPTYYATKFIYLDRLHWVLGRYLHARTPPISRLSYVGFLLLSDWCRWLLHPILCPIYRRSTSRYIYSFDKLSQPCLILKNPRLSFWDFSIVWGQNYKTIFAVIEPPWN